jgi:septal ring factor EnvC (AmiA/AmiB activator)
MAIRWIVALMVVPVLTLAAPAAPERGQTEAALQALTRELNALDTWLDAADQRRVGLLRELESRDRDVATISNALTQASTAVAEAQAALGALNRESDALKALQVTQARHIAQHATAAYRLAGEDFFKLLLNQESPATLDRMIRYHQYFSAARSTSLLAYQETRERLAENQRALAQQAAEAGRLRAEYETRQATLLDERAEREALIAALDEEAEDKAIERERLRADRARLEDLLAQLQGRAQTLDGRGFAEQQGKLPWPLLGEVRHRFGQSRAAGRMTWSGILIAADESTPVTAVYQGRVVFADWLRGFGLMTIIDHGSGYMTLYGQTDNLARQAGDWVARGEVLGQAGRSGGQQTAGVYFELRHNGRARDPSSWLIRQ